MMNVSHTFGLFKGLLLRVYYQIFEMKSWSLIFMEYSWNLTDYIMYVYQMLTGGKAYFRYFEM